jgi:hypothetical protein
MPSHKLSMCNIGLLDPASLKMFNGSCHGTY